MSESFTRTTKRLKIRSNSGLTSFPSRGVVVLSIAPPAWKHWKDDKDSAGITDLNFKNFFVYNFYTENERNLYSFSNPYRHNRYQPRIFNESGRRMENLTSRDQQNLSNFVPSYVHLSWDLESVEAAGISVANWDAIDDFKVITGHRWGNVNKFNRYMSQGNNSLEVELPIISRRYDSYELMERDWSTVSNRYLDMFSDLDYFQDNIDNPWFAEESGVAYEPDRHEFLWEEVINEDQGYKNFIGSYNADTGTSMSRKVRPGELSNHEMSDYSFPVQESSLVPTVEDSSLLERLNYPVIHNTGNSVTAVMNSEYASILSRASYGTTNKILGMQNRVRNMIHQMEFSLTGIPSQDLQERLTPFEALLNGSTSYYDETLPNFIDSQSNSVSDLSLVGFVIDKKEIKPPEVVRPQDISDNNDVDADPSKSFEYYPLIFIPCYRSHDNREFNVGNSYIDSAINYSSTYKYRVRAVFHFTATVNGTRYHYFVNSSRSKVLQIEARETTPPPPPRDFSVMFDYSTISRQQGLKSANDTEGRLSLQWSFPVNKQRDTRGFAIFRRCSIYEPFNLIKLMDFNYSISESESMSNIKLHLPGHFKNQAPGARSDEEVYRTGVGWYNFYKRLKPNEPKSQTYDDTFRFDKDYIYTICTLDAHGQISNYGTQISLRYDSRIHRLSSEQISPPGAPLVFPNWFLKMKAFQDVARVSKYRKAVLKFRPDYKRVKVGTENNPKLVNIVSGIENTEKDGHASNTYYLQIINPDRNQDKVFRYQINDLFGNQPSADELREAARLLGIPAEELEYIPEEDE